MTSAGLNVITYVASNQYGYKDSTFRSLVVYDGDVANNPDLTGSYKRGAIVSEVTKVSDGIWEIEDAYPSGSYIIPCQFGDLGDTKYMIAPGKVDGVIYSGFVVLEDDDLYVYIEIIEPNGDVTVRDKVWKKQ